MQQKISAQTANAIPVSEWPVASRGKFMAVMAFE